MSFTTTTLFNTVGRTNPISIVPSGYLSTFSQSVASNAGSGAFAMDGTVSAAVLAGQKSFQSSSFSSIPTATNQDIGMAQFLSSPLTAQIVATAGVTTWTVRAAMQVSNAAANFTWTFRAALYLVNGSTGAIRTTIFALQNIGASARTLTTEQAVQATGVATANTATATDRDYLALEWGVNMNNTSGGNLTPNITIFADGNTLIAADTGVVSNAASQLISSGNITIYPIVGRVELPVSPAQQPRSPGWVRTEITTPPPTHQVRGPGWARAQFPTSPILLSRAGDIDQVVMRGFDSSLNKIVYWVAAGIDPNGTQYTGDQTKLSDIVAILLTNAGKI